MNAGAGPAEESLSRGFGEEVVGDWPLTRPVTRGFVFEKLLGMIGGDHDCRVAAKELFLFLRNERFEPAIGTDDGGVVDGEID